MLEESCSIMKKRNHVARDPDTAHPWHTLFGGQRSVRDGEEDQFCLTILIDLRSGVLCWAMKDSQEAAISGKFLWEVRKLQLWEWSEILWGRRGSLSCFQGRVLGYEDMVRDVQSFHKNYTLLWPWVVSPKGSKCARTILGVNFWCWAHLLQFLEPPYLETPSFPLFLVHFKGPLKISSFTPRPSIRKYYFSRAPYFESCKLVLSPAIKLTLVKWIFFKKKPIMVVIKTLKHN